MSKQYLYIFINYKALDYALKPLELPKTQTRLLHGTHEANNHKGEPGLPGHLRKSLRGMEDRPDRQISSGKLFYTPDDIALTGSV